MNIASRTRRLIAASLVFVGLASTVSHAQTVNVNGTACASASVTLGAGTININTAGCTGGPVAQPPTISSLSASSAAPGDTITINGTNLNSATVTVTIGLVQATITSNTGSAISTVVPTLATIGPGSVVVNTGVGSAASINFTVNTPPAPVAPTITTVAPSAGAPGTAVTLTGTGFSGATLTIGGAAATITSSSSTQITTIVPNAAVVGAGNVVVTTAVAPPASIAFTVNAGAPVDISIDGNTLPNPSKLGFIIPALHPGFNGAGGEVNAYAMNPARCATTPALTRSWQHNIDLNDYKSKNAFDFFIMQGGEALSYKFTVGTVDASGGFIYNDAANAVVRPTFISITTAPCDFDTAKLVVGPNRNSCYQTGLNGNSVNWANITGTLPEAYCRLTKGQTYYMNIRFQDGRPTALGGSPTSDSCTSGNCGGIIQVL